MNNATLVRCVIFAMLGNVFFREESQLAISTLLLASLRLMFLQPANKNQRVYASKHNLEIRSHVKLTF
jgi:hypothetical protein